MTSAAAPAGDSAPDASRGRRGRLAALWLASAAVLAACGLASFRVGFAQDVATLARVNGPRLLLGAAAGALLAIAGTARRLAGGTRPLFELEILGIAAGGAAGGFLAVQAAGRAPLPAFVAGALAGGGLLLAAARALDRPRRATNAGAAAFLVVAIAAASLAGTYARARRDLVAPTVAWLLGDLSGASWASGGVLLAGAAAIGLAASHAAGAGARARASAAGWIAFGAAIGAAGPLVFVGSLVPAAVGWIAGAASPAAAIATASAAGAAAVVAIDTVPRLLVGGYDFPFAVPAGMLAIPIFLGWNRVRLRRLAGRGPLWAEALEVAAITALTAAAAGLALFFAQVVRQAT